jgi:hypothetical protein
LSFSLLSKNEKIKIYRSIILHVVLHGCGTLLITLKEEHRLCVFGNSVLRRIFGPKRDKVIGKWGRLHNEEIYDLYSSPNLGDQIKKSEMGKACSAFRKQDRHIQGFGGTPDRIRPLGRPRSS